MLPYGFDGNFADYANGTYVWHAAAGVWQAVPTAFLEIIGRPEQDMWHAAINSRGHFYPVKKGKDLAVAFRSILKDIHDRSETNWSDRTASNSNASRNQVGIYLTSYSPKLHWKGWISAKSFGGVNARQLTQIPCGAAKIQPICLMHSTAPMTRKTCQTASKTT